jgi:hypothetical protein
MLIEDGSAASPGLAFASDTNTGIFRPSSNTIALTASGENRLQASASECVVNEGSQDFDFRVESNGETHMLFVDAGNDRVGIGDPTPSEKLNVAGNLMLEGGDQYLYLTNAGTGNNGIYIRGNTASTYLRSHTLGSFNWEVNGSEKMKMDSAGRLMLGTTTEGRAGATDNLTIAGSADCGITIRSGTSNDGAIDFSDSTSGDGEFAGQILYDHGSNFMRFMTASSERIRIDSSGRLLINTTSSAGELIHGVGGGLKLIRNKTGSPTSGQSLMSVGFHGVDDTNSNGAAEAKIEAFASENHSGTAAGADLRFYTKPNGTGPGSSPTERMRINSSGQVLVGQTSATSVLGNGVGIKSNAVGSNYNEGALSLTGTGGDFYGLTFAKSGSNTAEGFGFLAVFSGGTDSLQIGYNSGSSDQFICTFSQNGNVNVAGALSKGSGSFRIDHPLPAKTETHDLVHSFIEGPQADLIYRGKVDLVAGAATVNLDTAARMTEGTFVLLNTNIQCFTSNESDWTAVRGSVSGNTLTIAAEDNTSTATVSWLVIGERQDQHMIDTDWTDDNGRVITEPEKPS